MIRVENLYKRYVTDQGPGDWVLNGVSFTIPPKVSVGLVGRNGAGKSTLLRLIGGTDVPTRGKVERNCRVSWPMGYSGGLQGSLTGRQNAKFVCRIHGHADDIRERLAFIEDFAELGAHFEAPVKTYSAGMKSRLNFAISMAFDFEVYISDEVTAAGDAAFRNKAEAAFKKLSDRASIIMVSHGEGTLRRFCSAGIWLHEGKAYWFDDIEDALKAYKDSLPSNVPPPTPDKLAMNSQRQVMLGRIASLRQSLTNYETGLNGRPFEVSDAEIARFVQHAKQIGMELLTEEQIAAKGRVLKPGAIPIMNKKTEAGDQQWVGYFDFAGQSEAMTAKQ